jgi:CheY-like chemotaxis protein
LWSKKKWVERRKRAPIPDHIPIARLRGFLCGKIRSFWPKLCIASFGGAGKESRPVNPETVTVASAIPNLLLTSNEASAQEPHELRRILLVVDDEADLRDSLKALFEHAWPGVRVLTASSGVQALEVMESESVHAIVADYRMPGMNGVELLARSRRHAPDIARVLITAYPDMAGPSQMVHEAAADLVLAKPLDPEALVERVQTLLLRRHGGDLA